MSLRRFISLVLLCSTCFAQNGRNYAPRYQVLGNTTQTGNDGGGNNGYLLAVPIHTGAGPYKSWGQLVAVETVADTTGTQSHGMAIYDSGGNLICSVYGIRTTAVGDNSYTLSGCGIPASNADYTIGYLTDASSAALGTNHDAKIASEECPGTSSFSSYASVGGSFPSTLPAMTDADFCWTFSAQIILAAGSNGRNYAGPLDETGVQAGPWNGSGTYYGGLNTGITFVNFSDGLADGVYPTTTQLGDATHGTSCGWSLATTNEVLAGAAAGHKNLLTPVVVGGSTYSGTGSLTLAYNTDSTRNRVICDITPQPLLSVGYHFISDVPITDTGMQYDLGGIYSTTSNDILSPTLLTYGASEHILLQCEHNGTGSNLANVVTVYPNVNYWIWLKYQTDGATDTMSIFNQDEGGVLVGTVTCTSNTGVNNAEFVASQINGSEDNTIGLHVWTDQFIINTNGDFIAP